MGEKRPLLFGPFVLLETTQFDPTHAGIFTLRVCVLPYPGRARPLYLSRTVAASPTPVSAIDASLCFLPHHHTLTHQTSNPSPQTQQAAAMAAARTTRATTSSSAAPFMRLEREQACKGNLMALSMIYSKQVSTRPCSRVRGMSFLCQKAGC